MHRIPSELRS